jgi:phosphosulfolactate synthase (CoM biosynthesis protein A)
MVDRAFPFVPRNDPGEKPRPDGITAIRGPYYSPLGPRYLQDLLETVGEYVDILKFSGGSFALMPRAAVRELIGLCHEHDVRVSTGGFIEHVLARDAHLVEPYLDECAALEFDIVEISRGFITLTDATVLDLVSRVQERALGVHVEVGIQFGAGGATSAHVLREQGTTSAAHAIAVARRAVAAGAQLIVLESEGITENVETWRTDVIAQVADALGAERVLFEAADPAVFTWYIKEFGTRVNLFIDHAQILQLAALRAGIWGTADVWGRVVS